MSIALAFQQRKLSMVLPARTATAFLLLATVACDAAPKGAAPAAALTLPAEVCEQAGKTLQDMKKRGPFEFASDGTATIFREVWDAAGEGGQEQLSKALAYNAACASAQPPAEKEIMIQSEFGQILSKRTIQVAPDAGQLLNGAGSTAP
jgi:hypothetical protein